MAGAGEPVWVRHERAAVWHRTRWAADGRSVERPLCGESAMYPPAWLRWMGAGEPTGGRLCGLCLALLRGRHRVSV